MQTQKFKIFISHAWEDKSLVRRLEKELAAANAEIWVDHIRLRGGDNLPKRVSDALEWCDTLLLVWSKAARGSQWVEVEWTNAIVLGKRIISCILDKTQLPSILASAAYIDFRNIENGIVELTHKLGLAEKQPAISPQKESVEKISHASDVRSIGDLPRIWNVPHSRNPDFTDREDLLSNLRTALTSQQSTALIQVIHGLGGVGKTQLALEYVYRFAGDYDVVWWIRSEVSTTLAADYANLAYALDLPEKNAAEQSIIIAAVHTWLNQHSAWLLVFDNAQHPDDLRPYLSQRTTGHVVITSKNRLWHHRVNLFEVRVFDLQNSVGFLYKRTGQVDKETAIALAEELGYMPLALAQAAGYINAANISSTDYLELYRQHKLAVLGHGSSSADYLATLATTLEFSFRQITDQVPATRELLNLCAFLAPTDIPRDILSTILRDEPSLKMESLNGPLAFTEAVTSLHNYSLIEVKNGMFSVHRLVQAYTRDRLSKTEQKKWTEIVVQIVEIAFPVYSNDIRFWPLCTILLPHAIAIVEYAEKYNVSLDRAGRLLNRMGLYLKTRAIYSDAESFYRHALKIREKQLGPEHPDVAICLNNLASLLQEQGKYSEVEPLYRRALAIYERQTGPENPEVALSLSNLASLLRSQGKYSEAEPLYRLALKIREKQLGPEHPDVATSLNNLALLLRSQGKYSEAEPLYRHALDIYEKRLGSEHPDVATGLNNLAGLFQSLGEYTKAEPLYRRALKIREKQLGADHPDVATSLNNLALLLQEQKKYSKAEPLYRRALEIWEKSLGSDHPEVAYGLNNLALLLADQGYNDEAELLLRRALEIYEKQLDPGHPNTALVRNNLTYLLQKADR